MPLQQTTLVNLVAKGEIAHNEQFLDLPQCFQTLFNYQTFIYRDILIFCLHVFKVVCFIFVVCGKNKTRAKVLALSSICGVVPNQTFMLLFFKSNLQEQPSCAADGKHLKTFGREPLKKHFCEYFLNLG